MPLMHKSSSRSLCYTLTKKNGIIYETMHNSQIKERVLIRFKVNREIKVNAVCKSKKHVIFRNLSTFSQVNAATDFTTWEAVVAENTHICAHCGDLPDQREHGVEMPRDRFHDAFFRFFLFQSSEVNIYVIFMEYLYYMYGN